MPWQEDVRPITWQKLTGSVNTSIAVGGTAQNLILGPSPYRGFSVWNSSTNTAQESLWLEVSPDTNGPAVVGGSMEIPFGGNMYFGPAQGINNAGPSIVGATGGHTFVVYVGR